MRAERIIQRFKCANKYQEDQLHVIAADFSLNKADFIIKEVVCFYVFLFSLNLISQRIVRH